MNRAAREPDQPANQPTSKPANPFSIMPTLLIKNAELLVTMNGNRDEIRSGGLFARDGMIEAVGTSADLPELADEVVDMTGHVVLPGLINTHHHFYQTLTRALPAAQNANLFNWLKTLYPIWGRMRPDDIYISTRTALAELALSGCTTAFDHLYLYPNGARLDDEIRAAGEVGLRLHASRGSMSLGESEGGLPPDSVVETDDRILDESVRLIQAWPTTIRGPAHGSGSSSRRARLSRSRRT
jgi:cytosine/adenosine deaminase-related metal-dependent hydrolase